MSYLRKWMRCFTWTVITTYSCCIEGVCHTYNLQRVDSDAFNRLPVQLQHWWLVLYNYAKQHLILCLFNPYSLVSTPFNLQPEVYKLPKQLLVSWIISWKWREKKRLSASYPTLSHIEVTIDYLFSLSINYRPSRSLRFCNRNSLLAPRSKSVFSSRCFHPTGPKTWNNFLDSVRQFKFNDVFRT